jgi:hypothetical protein
MKSVSKAPALASLYLAWLTVALTGVVGPAAAILLLMDWPEPVPLAVIGGPVLAVGLMGAGMIGAATARSLLRGVLLALLTGMGLIGLVLVLGGMPLVNPVSTGLAIIIASLSFAARGALFARFAADKGWLIAVLVVGGEAAMLLTASVQPDALPDWLLALLPAQWASMAIRTALFGAGTWAAGSAVFALAGTAAATLLVALMWPRRWTYVIMFTVWIACSALVWHSPAPTILANGVVEVGGG